MIHGANDSLVPVEQARSFVAMLRAESKSPVAYAELPGAQHAFEVFDSPRTIFSAGAVHRFLEVGAGPPGPRPDDRPRGRHRGTCRILSTSVIASVSSTG